MAVKRGREAASYNIPSDLCEEILHRLPSTDLLNFKRVCKDWQRLISSKGFIHKHLQRSKADCNHLRIVVNFNSTNTAEIIDFANNTRKKISSDHCHILGCCDGLVLYYDICLNKIAALNPCTGESLLLVTMPKQCGRKLGRFMLKLSWFRHHPVTGQYVLVLAHGEESGSIKIEVYSLSRDPNSLLLISSSTLHDQLDTVHSFFHKCNQIGYLLHGRLHCPVILFNRPESSYQVVILVYDFETNKITIMTYPALKRLIWMLGMVDGCLFAIQDRKVWMMKEYGVEQSWTKYAKLDGTPFAVSPNGDVFTRSDDGFTITKYTLRERGAKIVSKFHLKMTLHNCINNATVCIDSLISPTLLWREEE